MELKIAPALIAIGILYVTIGIIYCSLFRFINGSRVDADEEDFQTLWSRGANASSSVEPLTRQLGPLVDAINELKEVYDALQPKVTVVENEQATKVFGSISMPGGSPWCQGRPTFWLVGHQNPGEAPFCQQENGTWVVSDIVELDAFDELNSEDSNKVDRHDCAVMDVNKDGKPDVICLVGADQGQGEGFNELYLTQSDGSLKKIKQGHGLQVYPSMRSRLAATLKDPQGNNMILIGTNGANRDDGLPNQHRLFRNIFEEEGKLPYFEIQGGPWVKYFDGSCVLASDVNGDGIDDLVMCNGRGDAFIFTQLSNGSWRNLDLTGASRLSRWNNVRVADIDGDGSVDLVVVSFPDKMPTFQIFKGSPTLATLFDFENPLYEEILPFSAPDVEVLDVNSDGRPDIYVIQNDQQTEGTYCATEGRGGPNAWWGMGPTPPRGWVPPLDTANDLLYVGGTNDGAWGLTRVTLEHSFPGCGFLADRFGSDRAMVLGQGDYNHAGFHLLLEW